MAKIKAYKYGPIKAKDLDEKYMEFKNSIQKKEIHKNTTFVEFLKSKSSGTNVTILYDIVKKKSKFEKLKHPVSDIDVANMEVRMLKIFVNHIYEYLEDHARRDLYIDLLSLFKNLYTTTGHVIDCQKYLDKIMRYKPSSIEEGNEDICQAFDDFEELMHIYIEFYVKGKINNYKR